MDNKEEIQILSKKSVEKIKTDVKNQKDANEMRSGYRNKAFIMLWQLLFIIAIPAVIAFYFGKKLDGGDGKIYTLTFLGIALVLTWTMIIVKYKRYNQQVKKIEDQIKKNKQN